MDPREILISKAGWRDYNALAEFERLCFSPEDAWPWIDLVYVLMGTNFKRLKMEAGGLMIAFAAGEIKAAEGRGWVATIAVHPDWRGKGLGTRLLLALEEALRMPKVRLTTRRSNTGAIAMYRKQGYHLAEVWDKYYYGGEDGLVFEKTLNT